MLLCCRECGVTDAWIFCSAGGKNSKCSGKSWCLCITCWAGGEQKCRICRALRQRKTCFNSLSTGKSLMHAKMQAAHPRHTEAACRSQKQHCQRSLSPLDALTFSAPAGFPPGLLRPACDARVHHERNWMSHVSQEGVPHLIRELCGGVTDSQRV